ncbi:MAG: trigger factor [Rhodospirillales bacterium]
MQVTEINAEGLKREFKVVLAAAEIDEKVSARLDEVSKNIRMPGFRPGKVPTSLLRKQYGQAVMGEVLEQAINDSSQQTIMERGLKPAIQPKIEIAEGFEPGKDLEFSMQVELLPEIELIDFSTVELTRFKVPVADEQVNDALTRIADGQKSSEAISSKRKSKAGDIAVIDFLGKVDGVAFDGGAGEDFHLELGSGMFIPGFEDQVTGAKAGDEIEVNVNFPEDYGHKALAGKAAVFEVKVKELRESKPAEIDDELAKKLGMESLDKLKEQIRSDIEREYANVTKMRLKRDLLDYLDKNQPVEAPSGLVEQEFDAIWQQFEQAKSEDPSQIDPDDLEKPEDELKAEYRKIAERRVRLGLILSEVGQGNNIQIQQEDLNRAMMTEARRYPGQEAQVIQYFQQNPQAMEGLRAPLMEDKVVDFILEMAKIKETESSIEDVTKDPEEAASEDKTKPKKKAAKKKTEEA